MQASCNLLSSYVIDAATSLMGQMMLKSEVFSPDTRKAVVQQMKKGGYKLPSLQSFNVETYGTVGHVLYAGNM